MENYMQRSRSSTVQLPKCNLPTQDQRLLLDYRYVCRKISPYSATFALENSSIFTQSVQTLFPSQTVVRPDDQFARGEVAKYTIHEIVLHTSQVLLCVLSGSSRKVNNNGREMTRKLVHAISSLSLSLSLGARSTQVSHIVIDKFQTCGCPGGALLVIAYLLGSLGLHPKPKPIHQCHTHGVFSSLGSSPSVQTKTVKASRPFSCNLRRQARCWKLLGSLSDAKTKTSIKWQIISGCSKSIWFFLRISGN